MRQPLSENQSRSRVRTAAAVSTNGGLARPTRWLAAAATSLTLGFAGLTPTIALAGPLPLVAGPSEEVEAVVAEAVTKFQAKEYEAAVVLFEQAYEMSPEPNYLYNIGRVYEESGNLEKAVEFYGRFVKLGEVDLGAREVALERLRVLRGVLEETAEKPDEPIPDETPDEVDDPTGAEPTDDEEVQDPVPDEPKKPDGMRIAGFVLLGVGVGAVAGGGAFGALALARENDLNTLATLETRDSAVTRGKRNALAADILFGVGGAMVVTGVVLVALSYSKKRAGQRAMIAPTFVRGGGGLAAEVRF